MQDWERQVATARPGLSTVLFATEAIGADSDRSRRRDPALLCSGDHRRLPGCRRHVGSPIASATADDLGGAAYNRERLTLFWSSSSGSVFHRVDAQ